MPEILTLAPWLFYLGLTLLGLIVGSFLNVVIYRLPIMMQHEWDQQLAISRNDGEQSDAEHIPGDAVRPAFNLSTPRSACPKCQRPIRAIENIPVISYLALGGRCAGCKVAIGARYPLVEILTAALTFAVAWRFGIGFEALAGVLLTWYLIAMSGIDIDHQLLPDTMTLPLVWIGLFLSLFHVPNAQMLFISPPDAIIGALAGYLSLWGVYHVFRLVTGKHGMGYGDFKLLAALGAWFGWQLLPLIILLSATVGAIYGITMIVFKRHRQSQPMPFGPWLAAAGFCTLMFGDALNSWYLNLLGM